MYQERNNQIKKYFMEAPEKLLTIDVSEEENTTLICKFLNIPPKLVVKMPHANKS